MLWRSLWSCAREEEFLASQLLLNIHYVCWLKITQKSHKKIKNKKGSLSRYASLRVLADSSARILPFFQSQWSTSAVVESCSKDSVQMPPPRDPDWHKQIIHNAKNSMQIAKRHSLSICSCCCQYWQEKHDPFSPSTLPHRVCLCDVHSSTIMQIN